MLVANQGRHELATSSGSGCSCGPDVRRAGQQPQVTAAKSTATKNTVAPAIVIEAADNTEDEIPDNKLGLLIQELKLILGPNKGLACQDIDIDKVKAIMEQYESNEEDWAKYALHDKSRNYSRNGIIDINGNANLLVLVWTPTKSSPIHDHANAHCCMKILKGTLKESLYDMPESEGHELRPRTESLMTRDQVGYISDDIGLHKISNPDPNEFAVSLHLYTPPYASLYGCSMYESTTGRKHHVDMSKYYSWQGKLTSTSSTSSTSTST